MTIIFLKTQQRVKDKCETFRVRARVRSTGQDTILINCGRYVFVACLCFWSSWKTVRGSFCEKINDGGPHRSTEQKHKQREATKKKPQTTHEPQRQYKHKTKGAQNPSEAKKSEQSSEPKQRKHSEGNDVKLAKRRTHQSSRESNEKFSLLLPSTRQRVLAPRADLGP